MDSTYRRLNNFNITARLVVQSGPHHAWFWYDGNKRERSGRLVLRGSSPKQSLPLCRSRYDGHHKQIVLTYFYLLTCSLPADRVRTTDSNCVRFLKNKYCPQLTWNRLYTSYTSYTSITLGIFFWWFVACRAVLIEAHTICLVVVSDLSILLQAKRKTGTNLKSYPWHPCNTLVRAWESCFIYYPDWTKRGCRKLSVA